jgi:hypothetical protein
MARAPNSASTRRLGARQRSETLLRALVGAEAYARSIACGYLETLSPQDPQRVYRIPWKRGFVRVVERGQLVESLCIGPRWRLPAADVLVTHKLLIEADEQRYLAIANHFPGSVGDGSLAQFRAYLALTEREE